MKDQLSRPRWCRRPPRPCSTPARPRLFCAGRPAACGDLRSRSSWPPNRRARPAADGDLSSSGSVPPSETNAGSNKRPTRVERRHRARRHRLVFPDVAGLDGDSRESLFVAEQRLATGHRHQLAVHANRQRRPLERRRPIDRLADLLEHDSLVLDDPLFPGQQDRVAVGQARVDRLAHAAAVAVDGHLRVHVLVIAAQESVEAAFAHEDVAHRRQFELHADALGRLRFERFDMVGSHPAQRGFQPAWR